MAEINVRGFSGANNVKVDERFYSKVGIAEPRVILNADIDVTGQAIIRAGKTLFWNLPRSHSLWAGNTAMFCVADGILYRNIQGVATNVGAISGPKYPLSYIDAENLVYMSNPYWQGVFDPTNNVISSWGIPHPPGPMLLLGDGNLPAGTYYVCITNVVNGEISGNGPIASITLTETGGIQVLNRASDTIVWTTEANEYVFYRIGVVNKIVNIPTVEPLPSLFCSPPPFMENLCYAFGRIWGSVGPDVYYCCPFKLGWFKLTSNKYSFEDTVTMIAKVSTGLFIGTNKRTRFLAGTIPEQMTQIDAGAGSIKGTLTYCNNMPELGWTLGTPEKDFVDVPVWVTTEGVVVGSTTGKLFNITKNKLKMAIPSMGASLYRNRAGIIQFLTSFKHGRTGSGQGFMDSDTLSVFDLGKIMTNAKTPHASNSTAGFSDSATCEVRRGGVLI